MLRVSFGIIGCLGGPYGAIGGLMKTLKYHWFLLCFECSEVLGRAWALEILLGPWGLLWEALEGLGGPWEVPEGSLGIFGGSLRVPWVPIRGNVEKTVVFFTFPRGARLSQGTSG